MNYPKVIGVMGRMGSGKDTLADYLVNQHGYVKLSFSDLLREELANCLESYRDTPINSVHECLMEDFPAAYNEIIGAFVEGVHNYPACRDWLLEKSPASRTLQQWYGTEYRRAQDYNYWIKLWMDKAIDAGFTDPGTKFVIPSVRFENEALFSNALGQSWRVWGREIANEGIEGHTSENIPEDLAQFHFANDGTLPQLYEIVEQVLKFNYVST